MVIPYCTVSKLAFARAFGKCVADCHPDPHRHTYGNSCTHADYLFSNNTSTWFCFSRQNDYVGLWVQHFRFFWVTSSVTLSVKHWFVTALMLFKDILHEVFFFALPYAALFMFSFYPAIHHSSVPWFKLWATLTELVHWSELGQVWNMNWVHVWVWLRVWCFSLLHVLPSFDLVYFVFPA